MTESAAAESVESQQEATEPQSQATDTQASESNAPESRFSIPEEYRDRGWAKKVESEQDLWKAFDNAQSMLGKRPAGIPAEDAPQEEWDSFYKALGRPESADDYKLSEIEGVEGEAAEHLKPIQDKAKSILHEAGIPQKQADSIWKAFVKAEIEAMSEASVSLDAKFDELTSSHFGENYDKVQQRVLDSLKDAPEEFRNVIANADPVTQAATIFAVNQALEKAEAEVGKYKSEDSLTSGDQSSGQSIEETRKELAKLRTSDAAKDFLHPENKATREKIEALSVRVSNYYNRK